LHAVHEVDFGSFNALIDDANQGTLRHANEEPITDRERLAIFEGLQALGTVSFEPDSTTGKYKVHHPTPTPTPTERLIPPIVDRTPKERLKLKTKHTLGSMALGIQGRIGYTGYKQFEERQRSRAEAKRVATEKESTKAAFDTTRSRWERTRHTALKLQYEGIEIERTWKPVEKIERVGRAMGGTSVRDALSGVRDLHDDPDVTEQYSSGSSSARTVGPRSRSSVTPRHGNGVAGSTPRGGQNRVRSFTPAEQYQHDLEQYDEMLEHIDQLRKDPTYGALVSDPNKLAQLHKDIQREAWPLYEARLQELNQAIEAGNKFVSDDNKQPPLASVKDMPTFERQKIVKPIDARLTKEFLEAHLPAGTVVPDDVMRTFTTARLVARGKIRRPNKDDPKYRRTSP
jgi:hypothetical protein